jgi:hypothetical protein
MCRATDNPVFSSRRHHDCRVNDIHYQPLSARCCHTPLITPALSPPSGGRYAMASASSGRHDSGHCPHRGPRSARTHTAFGRTLPEAPSKVYCVSAPQSMPITLFHNPDRGPPSCHDSDTLDIVSLSCTPHHSNHKSGSGTKRPRRPSCAPSAARTRCSTARQPLAPATTGSPFSASGRQQLRPQGVSRRRVERRAGGGDADSSHSMQESEHSAASSRHRSKLSARMSGVPMFLFFVACSAQLI